MTEVTTARIITFLFFQLTVGCTGLEPVAPTAPGGTTPGVSIEARNTDKSTPPAQQPAAVNTSTGAPPPARKTVNTAIPAKAPTTAPLDLTALEKRLRETAAIGVFTKIALKNQVDDLLSKFRAYYQCQARTTLADLRQPYDMLLLKVLSLLQDDDPALARAIVASREEIWGMLADRNRFATL